jgi:hypothetical protein
LRHQPIEWLVGRRQDANIDADRARAAHAFELRVLQHAQQFRLCLQRQVADFIEK